MRRAQKRHGYKRRALRDVILCSASDIHSWLQFGFPKEKPSPVPPLTDCGLQPVQGRMPGYTISSSITYILLCWGRWLHWQKINIPRFGGILRYPTTSSIYILFCQLLQTKPLTWKHLSTLIIASDLIFSALLYKAIVQKFQNANKASSGYQEKVIFAGGILRSSSISLLIWH